MPPKRMTANPVKPSRHRAGKQTGVDSSSDSDSDADEATTAPAAIPPPPKATSAGKIISNLGKVDLNARRQEAQVAEARRLAAEKAERLAAEEGFVTEEESGAEDAKDDNDESDGSEEDDSEEEESSEDEAPRRMMMRPKFVPKSQRAGANGQTAAEAEEAAQLAEEAARKEAADALVEEQIKKDVAARAAGKKHWDDDEDVASDVDTTDGLDPEAEEAAWRVRELKRLRRARAAIEEREKELAEVERRRNLTAEERAAEDAAFLEGQQREKDAKGRMGFMQRYFHKGAFFRDEAEAAGLLQRDLMGARVADDVKNREALPAYLQRRDMTKLGRKGATKYKDMRTEDTGSWGGTGDGPRRGGGGGWYDGDERFRPDDERFRPDDPAGGKGANAMPLGERRRDGGGRRRSRSRSRSPRRERDEYRGSRKRSTSPDRGEDKRRRVEADR